VLWAHRPKLNVIPMVGPIQSLVLVRVLQDEGHASLSGRSYKVRSGPPVVELEALLLRHRSISKHHQVSRPNRAGLDQVL
jgi:hypothetical protein